MTLFLLSRDDCNYDEYDAKLIRAESEAEARALANLNTGDEGKVWEYAEAVKCEVVEPNGQADIILESFNAG